MKTITNPKVELHNGYLTIKIPFSVLNAAAKKQNWKILDKVRGMWKNRKVDALAYQLKMRDEWK